MIPPLPIKKQRLIKLEHPKIIHYISSLSRGGRERQLATIVSNTDQVQYPTKILYLNKRQNSYIDEYGLNDFTIQIGVKGRFKRLKELHATLKREKPDIVYTWGNGESISVILLKPFHKFKVINGSIRHGIRSAMFSHYLRTLVLHLSSNIVANSKAGLKANNLRRGRVLYNGIDEKFLQPLSNRADIRQSLTGIPENIPLLISVANLVPYKDYFSVLDALKELKTEGYEFYYLILGDGPMRLVIESKIADYNLQQNIRIVGNVQNVSEYLKVSDIFIHSSKGEGCSNAILEAMAAGLPIIASDTGGTSEIVTNEVGMLFEYKNHNQLKDCLVLLIKDTEKRVEYGSSSYDKAVRDFTVLRMMEDYYNLMENLK